MSYIYTRKANYYETDMMGIVHHSNHIRYFEEARIAFMHSIGCDVMQMERDGIIIPNVDAYARYYIPVRFSEEIDIEIRLSYFNGTKMEYTYTARNKNRISDLFCIKNRSNRIVRTFIEWRNIKIFKR